MISFTCRNVTLFVEISYVLINILQTEEARIAKEVKAHNKRIRKELEKQNILRRKVLI